MPVTLHVAADHRAIENIEGSKQGSGAMALVIMGHHAAPALIQGKARLRPVERLDLALFIDGKEMAWAGVET